MVIRPLLCCVLTCGVVSAGPGGYAAAPERASTDGARDPVPTPPPVLATVDDLAAEVARLKELLAAVGIETESPPPVAEREAVRLLQTAGYRIRMMSQAERLAIARQRQDERLAAERAAEDAELAQRIAAAVTALETAGYLVTMPPSEPEPPPIAETPEPAPEPEPDPGPTYPESQLALLSITRARNSRLQAHPALMASAQRLANYHAQTGRWGHSSRSWRGNASENIAHNGAGSVAELGRQWTRSRGHNSNWLSSWQYVGVGVAYSRSGRVYGVQHFSNSPTGASSGAVVLQGVSRRRGWLARLRSRR